MHRDHQFEFLDAPPGHVSVVVDERDDSEARLLKHLAKELGFPYYFGENWDALDECLSELPWTRSADVVVDHAVLPRLTPDDLSRYLHTLVGAMQAIPGGPARLRVIFRTKDRAAVEEALARMDP